MTETSNARKDPVALANTAKLLRSVLTRHGLSLDDLDERDGPWCDCGQHGQGDDDAQAKSRPAAA